MAEVPEGNKGRPLTSSRCSRLREGDPYVLGDPSFVPETEDEDKVKLIILVVVLLRSRETVHVRRREPIEMSFQDPLLPL